MVISRHILFVLVLLAAVGLPYVLTNDQVFHSARTTWDTLWSGGAASRSPTVAVGRSEPVDAAAGGGRVASRGATGASSQIEQTVKKLREISARTAPKDSPRNDLTGPFVNHPAELFRFDVPPEWVGMHWSRVTHLPPAQGLEVLRVPVTSGTGPHDIAGVMSYYFDAGRQVQRVTFSGTTHAPGPLVEVLMRHYGLVPQPAVGGRFYASQDGEKVVSGVSLKLMGRIGTSENLPKYQVEAELNRPGQSYGVGDTLQRIMSQHAVAKGANSPRPAPPVSDPSTSKPSSAAP